MVGGEQRKAANLLPPFCEPRVVFATVVVAELLVCVVTLSSVGEALGSWRGFSLASLYVQWVALTTISLLCVSRERLSRLGATGGLFAAWLLVLIVTCAGALIAWWLDHRFSVGLTPARMSLAAFVLINIGVGALVSAAALRYLHVQSEWERQIRAEAQSRVEALQARIRPHFLFNSMNTIASLIRIDPDQAEDAVEDLSDLFRGALKQSTDSDLGRELALVRSYLSLEQLRLGERLQVEWALNGVPEDARLPPLTLQPLVENAIYHGIQPNPGRGVVRIIGKREGDNITLAVENPLPPAAPATRQAGNQMAQDNIAQRIKLYFGGRGALHVDRTHERYRAVLSFPYKIESRYAYPPR